MYIRLYMHVYVCKYSHTVRDGTSVPPISYMYIIHSQTWLKLPTIHPDVFNHRSGTPQQMGAEKT